MTTLSSPMLRAPAQAASALAGGLLALGFGAVALRHGERPCHPWRGDPHRLSDLSRYRDKRGAVAR